MKSIRWLMGGERLSVAPLLLLAALGCGLQEHPRAGTRGQPSGDTGGTGGASEPEPPVVTRDAAIAPGTGPAVDAEAAVLEVGAPRPDVAAPPVTGPGVMINGTMVPREKVIV